MNINTLLDLARVQGATLATAESCTGGMIAAALVALNIDRYRGLPIAATQ